MKNRNSWSILLCLVIVCSALSAFSLESYNEDFSITNWKHPATTADWNTADGELKLFPFVSELQGI